jgi:hypothetical protein
MFSHTSLVGHAIHVHLAVASLSAVTSFMRGTFVLDPVFHTVRLGKHPAIALPAGVHIEEGSPLNFALVALGHASSIPISQATVTGTFHIISTPRTSRSRILMKEASPH